jgi:hypothetical protein
MSTESAMSQPTAQAQLSVRNGRAAEPGPEHSLGDIFDERRYAYPRLRRSVGCPLIPEWNRPAASSADLRLPEHGPRADRFACMLGGFIRAQRQMSNLLLRPLSALAAVWIGGPGQSQSAADRRGDPSASSSTPSSSMFLHRPHIQGPLIVSRPAPGTGQITVLIALRYRPPRPGKWTGHTTRKDPAVSSGHVPSTMARVKAWTPVRIGHQIP